MLLLVTTVLVSLVTADRCPMPYHCDNLGYCQCLRHERATWSNEDQQCHCSSELYGRIVITKDCSRPDFCFERDKGCECILNSDSQNPLKEYYYSNCTHEGLAVEYMPRCTYGSLNQVLTDGRLLCSVYKQRRDVKYICRFGSSTTPEYSNGCLLLPSIYLVLSTGFLYG